MHDRAKQNILKSWTSLILSSDYFTGFQIASHAKDIAHNDKLGGFFNNRGMGYMWITHLG